MQFRFVTPQVTASRGRVHWDFGDGQSSNQADPMHIYLHPGLYTVTMRGTGEAEGASVVNRVPVHRRPGLFRRGRAPDSLASYSTVLARYDPAKLDADRAPATGPRLRSSGITGPGRQGGSSGHPRERESLDSEGGIEVVRMVAGLLRDRLDDPEGALAFWRGGEVLGPGPWKAECEIEAADVALNDLLKTEAAKPLLESATARINRGGEPILSSRLNRVWGDWYARKGDKPSALAAYARAMASLATRRPAAEQQAWRGALSRSTEEFLRDQLSRPGAIGAPTMAG